MPESSGIKKFFANNWEKMALWTILIGLLFLLKPFLLLIFETFLITYIMKALVEWIVRRLSLNYRLTTVIVFLLFVSLLGAAGAWIGPRFVVESNQVLTDFAGEGEQQTREKMNRFIERIVRKVVGGENAQERYANVMETLKSEAAKAAKAALPGVLQGLLHLIKLGWEIVVSLLLAILFSFILVLDWRRIAAGMKTLETSRIRTFYLGAAPHLKAFADVLGKAFRAQAIIAACNTFLTVAGLCYLQVPNIALLSTVVFLCGFIPIVGTFLSSVPILLFGAQEGGLVLVLKLIALVAIVHAFEAYVLNPRITAGVLHVHPMLVLVLLLVGERFFGIWGMVLGVPMGYYIIKVVTETDEKMAGESEDGPPI